MTSTIPRTCRGLSLLLGTVLLLCLATGCSSPPKPAVLGFQTASTGRSFAQTFPRAYFSEAPDGDRDIVLIDEGFPPTPSASNGPVHPVAAVPLRQLVHFRILWNALHGTETDAPSATNAIIHWVIRTTDRSGNADSLRYQGAGFIQTYGGGDRLTLLIRNASIEATEHTGTLVDPLGRCSVTGTFTAVRNDDLVKAMIDEMHEGSAGASPVTADDGNGPPARLPTGP